VSVNLLELLNNAAEMTAKGSGPVDLTLVLAAPPGFDHGDHTPVVVAQTWRSGSTRVRSTGPEPLAVISAALLRSSRRLTDTADSAAEAEPFPGMSRASGYWREAQSNMQRDAGFSRLKAATCTRASAAERRDLGVHDGAESGPPLNS